MFCPDGTFTVDWRQTSSLDYPLPSLHPSAPALQLLLVLEHEQTLVSPSCSFRATSDKFPFLVPVSYIVLLFGQYCISCWYLSERRQITFLVLVKYIVSQFGQYRVSCWYYGGRRRGLPSIRTRGKETQPGEGDINHS